MCTVAVHKAIFVPLLNEEGLGPAMYVFIAVSVNGASVCGPLCMTDELAYSSGVTTVAHGRICVFTKWA